MERPVRCGFVPSHALRDKRAASIKKSALDKVRKEGGSSVVLSVRCVVAGRPALSDGMDSVPPTTKPDALA